MRDKQLATLAEVVRLLGGEGFEYWLLGGWAVDFHVGAVTREHDDVDLAVWRDDAVPIASLLAAAGWRHAPEAGEDGGTGYERGPVRVELTYLVRDGRDRVLLPLNDRDVVFSETPLGDEERELLGVRARVLSLALLRAGKSLPRDDPGDAAKDWADLQRLSAPAERLHADEIDIDAVLVAKLVGDQFPEWADLPLEPAPSPGTDNALYRLGEGMSVRLPRTRRATGQVEKDLRWLPELEPLLPLRIPVPLATGAPGHGYPWTWGIYRWLDGETAPIERVDEPERAALDLARFLAALQRLDPESGPPAGRSRGVPLVRREEETRGALAELHAEIDVDAAAASWEESLRAPEWSRAPVWLHGDLIPGNMLVHEGRLSAIIDFSALCVGDPACDLMVAWTFLTAGTRDVLRRELGVDDATWLRGRGWALSWAVIALPYYLHTHPAMARDARRTIVEVLS